MNNSPNLGDWIQRHQEDQLVIARCLVWLVHVRRRLLPQLLLPAAWKKKKKTLPTMHGLSRSTIYIYIYARKTLVWRNLFWMSTQAACFCCSASGCWEDEHCPMALSLSFSPSRCALICFAFFLGWRALGVWFYICCIGYGWARWWHSHHVILFLFYIISFKLVLITNMKKVPQSAITF